MVVCLKCSPFLLLQLSVLVSFFLFSDCFPSLLSTSSLVNGTYGFKLFSPIHDGFEGLDFGAAVSGLGDIDGDQIDDFIVSAPGGWAQKGGAYIIQGKSGKLALDGPINAGARLQSPPCSIQEIYGEATGMGKIGAVIAGPGDVNGDGFADIVIVSSNVKPEVHVIYGSATIFDKETVLEPAQVHSPPSNHTYGYAILGNSGSFGSVLSPAGDINRDGIRDILIGEGQGMWYESYVIFGARNRSGSYDLNTLLDGKNGFKVIADKTIQAISGVGDLNGDGCDDFIVQIAEQLSIQNYRPKFVIVFGNDSFPSSFNLSSSSSFTLECSVTPPLSQFDPIFASGVGDFNGDGFDDFSIYLKNWINLFFGNQTEWVSRTFDCQDGDISGLASSVNNADVNGDLLSDLIVGMRDNDNGTLSVIYGNQTLVLPPTLDFAFIKDVGFQVIGGPYFPSSVSNAGDVNNDGFQDIVVGEKNWNSAYVIFGDGQKSPISSSTSKKSSTSTSTVASPTSIQSSNSIVSVQNTESKYSGSSLSTMVVPTSTSTMTSLSTMSCPTCESLGLECNIWPESPPCSGAIVLNCGTCTFQNMSRAFCNETGQCECNRITCSDMKRSCGFLQDGCGATVSCGNCEEGYNCTEDGVCVHSECTSYETCRGSGMECGILNVTCDSHLEVNCGNCFGNFECTSHSFSCVCLPSVCGEKRCGTWSDNCGGTISCGDCNHNQFCSLEIGECVDLFSTSSTSMESWSPTSSEEVGEGSTSFFDSSLFPLVLLFIGIVACFLLVIVAIFGLHHLHASDSKLSANSQEDDLFSLQDVNIPYSELEIETLLGEGSFESIHKATYSGNDCVVKTLKLVTEESRNDFIKEVARLRTMKPHASLSTFFGACVNPEEPLAIVLEFIRGGNLENVVKTVTFSQIDILSLMKDLAGGMAHIHKQELVHCDLAARNCMVVSENPCRMKVCDFGLSRHLPFQQRWISVAGSPIPIRWSAPETLKEDKFFFGSDVWSFAVVAWECMTRQIPYSSLTNQTVKEYVISGNTLPSPSTENCSNEFYSLMVECWHKDPEARPSFNTILLKLTEWMKEASTSVQDQKPVEIHLDNPESGYWSKYSDQSSLYSL